MPKLLWLCNIKNISCFGNFSVVVVVVFVVADQAHLGPNTYVGYSSILSNEIPLDRSAIFVSFIVDHVPKARLGIKAQPTHRLYA